MQVRRGVAWGMTAVLCASTCAAGGLPPLVHERVLSVPAEKVWEVLSTSDGFKKMGPVQVDMDFKIGGKIRTKYTADGVLGDETTIENEILAFDPGRMLTIRCVKTPKGFQNPEAFMKTWTVITVDDLGESRSRLTFKNLGYGDDEASKQVRDFFDAGNAWVMDKLQSTLEGKPMPARGAHDSAAAAADAAARPKATLLSSPQGDGPVEVEAIVAAPPADVWRYWTTSEGWKSVMGVDTKIECAIGGPFELYFGSDAPPGERGSEGCKVLSYDEERMFSFSWNAPPKFKHARAERIWVVLTLEPADGGATRVRLTHNGWKEKIASQPEHAAEWKEVRTYFTNAWPRVLGAQVDHAATRSGANAK